MKSSGSLSDSGFQTGRNDILIRMGIQGNVLGEDELLIRFSFQTNLFLPVLMPLSQIKQLVQGSVPVGTRTLDPLIKSQLLYQLSYGDNTKTNSFFVSVCA